MRKFLSVVAVTIVSFASQAQYIQGSSRLGADPNKVDLFFRSNYSSKPNEYILFLQFSIAVPKSVSEGLTATATGANVFANMGNIAEAYQYTEGNQRIFTWIFANPVQ